jgi:hypothetical protein
MVNVEGGGCAMTGRIVSPSTIGTMNDEPLQIVWSVLNQDQFSLSSLTSKASLRLTFLTCNPDHSNNLYSIIQPATSTLRDLSFAKINHGRHRKCCCRSLQPRRSLQD